MKLSRLLQPLSGLLLSAALTSPAAAGPVFFATPDCGASCTVDMTYYGGPVMTGTTNVYVIWYGWGADSAKAILPDFFSSLTGSSYMDIALAYDDGHGNHVSNDIHYGGAIDRAADLGSNLSDAQIYQIVQDAQTSHALPTDSNAVYFVYTAPGIREQSDTSACGWHSNVGDTKYAWVSPNPGCDFLPGSVTGNDYADSLTETTSHELFEALTDPYVGDAFQYGPPLGWYDTNYGENGDMCVLSNLAADLNGKQFDVQSIWVRDPNNAQHGFCASGFNKDKALPEPSSISLALLTLGVLPWLRRRAR